MPVQKIVGIATLLATFLFSPLSSVAQQTTGHELCLEWKEKAKTAFPVSCMQNVRAHVVQDVLNIGSEHRFLVGVWGGQDAHRTEAIRVVNRMYREGKQVGIVFGPDRDTHLSRANAELDVEFEAYAHGRMLWDEPDDVGTNHLGQIATRLKDNLDTAYDTNYPVTKLD